MAGRRLRAKRPPPPLRLVEHGERGADPEAPDLHLRGTPAGAPVALLRLGQLDLGAGFQAIAAGCRPDGVVVGLGERPAIVNQARQLAAAHNLPWLCDPLLFLTGLPGYRTARHLQDLDYTPGRDADPYAAEEFDESDTSRRVARALVGAQVDLGASGAWSASFVMSGLHDPWIRVNQRLLRESVNAGNSLGAKTLVAGVPLRMMGFESLEAQRLAVRALSGQRPGAFVLMLDGLAEDSSPERIVAAIRFALLLQASGTPVILGRAGDLRHLFWAFGVRGTEFGLGRLLRFFVPDYRQRARGRGPSPGPRVEIPDLAASLPIAKARLLVGHVSECRCPACEKYGPIYADPAAVAQHDAHVVVAQARELHGVPPAARVEQLDHSIAVGGRQWRRLNLSGVAIGGPRNHDRWRRALELGVNSGLLEPARLAQELRLFDPETSRAG
jgi:hypothetical protein